MAVLFITIVRNLYICRKFISQRLRWAVLLKRSHMPIWVWRKTVIIKSVNPSKERNKRLTYFNYQLGYLYKCSNSLPVHVYLGMFISFSFGSYVLRSVTEGVTQLTLMPKRSKIGIATHYFQAFIHTQSFTNLFISRDISVFRLKPCLLSRIFRQTSNCPCSHISTEPVMVTTNLSTRM